jgi:multiple sugar transport system ATP-binding protein
VLPLSPARAAALPASGTVALGVRPEHLQLQAAGPGTLAVRVGVVEPLGSDTLVYFELDGVRHVARVAPEHTPATGDTVHLGVVMDRAHCFDPASGATLR